MAKKKVSEPLRAPEFRRGDILWVNCDPSLGVEPRKTQTCVVVSNDLANRFGAAVTVAPTHAWTSERAKRAYMVDLRAPASDLREPRIANASMVMTYDRNRVVSRAGRLSPEALARMDAALRMHLDLEKG